MRYQIRGRIRAGFTLIELLVVITIIAILVGLVTAGVIKYLDTIPTTQTVNDIRQLEVAIESFKAKFLMYPPSFIVLGNAIQYANYATTPAKSQQVANSKAYLSALWPRVNFNTYDWGIPGTMAVALEGDQCLVFFLNGPNGTGFSANPADPANAGGTRVGPFFEFPQNRLLAIAHPGTGQAANSFLSFMDGYGNTATMKGNVYAFFSSGRSAGGYGTMSGGSDCPTLTVLPYIQPNNRYYKHNSFQIISAGKNLAFGPGGAWPPGNPPAAYLPGPTNFPANGAAGSGVDDYSNFSGDMLGVF
jgi:prepilin-type N-terminal cleavage/methylation domain-containing protein